MILFVVLALVTLNAACVLGGTNRVIGSHETDITAVPYQALVLISSNEGFTPICGGSIITEKVILTAAHCFNNLDLPYYVRIGSSYRSRSGLESKVSDKIIHSDYKSNTRENDIALLVLKDVIPFNDYAQKIELPNSDEKLGDNNEGIISGWGKMTEEGKDYPEILRKTTVPIVNTDKCADAYSRYVRNIKPGMICAGDMNQGGIGPCLGDMGGPLVVDNKIYGISSWGNGCGRAKYPSVFTDVANYRTWIDTRLKNIS